MINTHLKVFDTEANYEAGKLNLDMPNVSYCEDTEKLKYLNSMADLYDIYGTLTGAGATATIRINGTNYTVTATGEDNHFGIVFSQPVTRFTVMSNIQNLKTLDKLDVDTSASTNMSDMFLNGSNLISIDTSNLNTSGVTNMSSMFMVCGKLTNIDVSHFDTSKVTRMNNMFNGCSSLTTLDLGNFNTSAVTSMTQMFYETRFTTINLSNFNTSGVTGMSYMFANNRNITDINISNWDTSNVSDMANMFSNCTTLTTVTMNNTNQTTFDMIKAQLVTDRVASHVTIIRDGVSYKYQNGAWVAQ